MVLDLQQLRSFPRNTQALEFPQLRSNVLNILSYLVLRGYKFPRDTRVFSVSEPSKCRALRISVILFSRSFPNPHPVVRDFLLPPSCNESWMRTWERKMALFPDRGGKSLDKLFNKDWSRFFYDEPVETWDEKCRSLILEWWRQFSIFFESRARQFGNYWHLYAVFFAGTLLVLTIHKSLRYLATIEFREKDNPEIRIGEQTCAALRGAGIVSNSDNDRDDDEEERRGESLVESRSTFTKNLRDAMTASDNDRSSSISSEATIVPADLPKARTDFLEALIGSMKPGGDDQADGPIFPNIEEIDDPESLDRQRESTLRRVDSENSKRYYVLTPWVEPSERASSSEESEISARKSAGVAKPVRQTDAERLAIGNDEPITETSKNPSNSVLEINEGESLAKTADLSADFSVDLEESNFEQNDISTLKDFVDKSAFPPLSIEVPTQPTLPLPEVPLPGSDGPPAESASSHRELVRKIDETIDLGGPKIRTDSKQRFRSLSQDDRSASNSAAGLEPRRGGSVSPPSGNKNRQRTTKQAQSKIPAPSIPAMIVADRAFRHAREIDASSISEAADQIRTALLRKLRDAWRPQPESLEFLPTTSSSKNSTNFHRSSIDSPSPEGVSRIPLPRKSPRARTSQ